MKIKNLVIVLIVIAILIFGAISVFTKTPVENVVSTAASTSTKTTTVTIRELKYATSTSEVIIQYPEFSNMPVLNEKTKKDAEALFATTTAELNSNLQSLIDFGVDMSNRSLLFQREFDETRMYINDKTNIASLVYEQYTDMGGAHGTFFYGSAVYDLSNGNELKLTDLLQNHEQLLRAYVRAEILKTATTSVTCEHCEYLEGRIDAQAELISPFFSVNENGLTFLYGAYDLASYAVTSAGQRVYIPKSVLAGMIKRDW